MRFQTKERNIFLFYTGIKRESSYVLTGQKRAAERGQQRVVDSLHTIKDIGKAIKKALEKGDPDQYGFLLDEHWNVKKQMSSKISSSWIDDCYEVAKKKGALGGKIMGAGGGGFFMFYCSEGRQKFRKAMKDLGLIEMPFKFDFNGTKVIADFF